jgi:hypothetical protein
MLMIIPRRNIFLSYSNAIPKSALLQEECEMCQVICEAKKENEAMKWIPGKHQIK